MRKVLILLLALCAFTTGMVLKEKRAVNTEDEQLLSETLASSTKPPNSREICQPHTPCAWSLYKNLKIKVVDVVVTNNYCICSPDTECVISEQDQTVNAAVHRCRAPGSRTLEPSNIDYETR